MAIYTFSQWVLFFYIYCFLGWVWESTYVSIKEKHLVNRGFLKGPFLPIYGTGALCILVATIPFRDNVLLMCLAGMASATVLEYVTGAVMEKIFHVRYWDYTGKFMNLNGHICLASTLCWGVMTVLVVDVFQVWLDRLVLVADEQIVTFLVIAVTPFVTADVVTSFRAAIHLRDLLIQWERAHEELEKLAGRREELEAALAERRAELEASVSERREALETVMNERKQDLETAVNERMQSLEELLGDQKESLGAAMKAAGDKASALFVEEKKELRAKKETEKESAKETAEDSVASGAPLLASIRELMDKIASVQERTNRLETESDLLRTMHGKSIRGLLKRNPKAVSFMNKEAFADLKQFMMKKQEDTKKDVKNETGNDAVNEAENRAENEQQADCGDACGEADPGEHSAK